jgi:hypothetical protein
MRAIIEVFLEEIKRLNDEILKLKLVIAKIRTEQDGK